MEQGACGAETGLGPDLEADTEEEKGPSDPACCWCFPAPQTPPQPPPPPFLLPAPPAAPDDGAMVRTVESSSWTAAAETAAPAVEAQDPADGKAAGTGGLKPVHLAAAPVDWAAIPAPEAAPEPDGKPAAAPRSPESAARGPLAEHPVAEVLLKRRAEASPVADLVQTGARGAEHKEASQDADHDGGGRGRTGEPTAGPLAARGSRPGAGAAPERREAFAVGRFPEPEAGAELLPGEAARRMRQAWPEQAKHRSEPTLLHAEAGRERSHSAAESAFQPAPASKLAGAGLAAADAALQRPTIAAGPATANIQPGPRQEPAAESHSAAAPPEGRPELPRSGNQLDVQVEGERGERVRIRLWDAAGSVRMRMTASEQRIAEVLRSGWPRLERALEHAGWHTEAAPSVPSRPAGWSPARQPGAADEPAASAARLNLEPSGEPSPGSHPGRDHASGRNRQESAREEWIDLSALRRLGAWRQS